MASTKLELTDKRVRFPVAYGYQPVRGWGIKSYDTVVGQSTRRTKQNALGEGPWDGIDKLWTDAFEVPAPDYHFHSGDGADAPDAFFPNDPPHPWTSYISLQAMAGLTEDQTDQVFGIYRTLRTGNYDGDGLLADAAGLALVVPPVEIRNAFIFKPNPANVAVDQLLRWGKRLNDIVNWPVWVDWRDYNDELIPWDDAKSTPRSLSLTPQNGGALTIGGTYYFRVAAMSGAEQSSASRKTVEIAANSVTLIGGQRQINVNWLVKGDELDPAAPTPGITGFRVYVGSAPGVWLGYFTAAGAGARNLLVTTTAGITAGAPLDIATAGLLRNIKRFECMPFFIPPYDLATALDKICQISCADWQWSSLGMHVYRNDKVRFMSPADRAPVFTLNLAETGMGSFSTYPIDRRSRPNEVVVNFRNRDEEFLDPDSVELPREQLQEDEGQTKTFTIEGGTMYRSQAQRCASFYARVLCDMDQMAAMRGSPKSYHLLPGDTAFVTNDTPDWVDVKFIVRKKEENVERNIGDPLTLQLYINGLYSDTDHSPVPRPLPAARLNPFAPPPVVDNIALSTKIRALPSGAGMPVLLGDVTFQESGAQERGRLWWRNPEEEVVVTSDHTTNKILELAHGRENGQPINFRNEVHLLPDPLDESFTYFVINKTVNNYQVALTIGGPAVNLTDNGVGPHYVAEFQLVPSYLVPDTDLHASFEIAGIIAGVHRVKVVTETLFGASLPFENHPIFELTFAGIPQVADPTDFNLFFDANSGDGLFAWSGEDQESASQVKFELEMRSDDNSTLLRPTILIVPSQIMNLQEWVIYDPASYNGLGPPTDNFTLSENGGTFINSGLHLYSSVGCEVIDGLLVQFQVPPLDVLPMHIMAVFPEGSTPVSTDDAFQWSTAGSWPNFTGSPEPSYDATTPTIPISPGDWLGILVRQDLIVEYHYNFSESSKPVWVSGRPIDPSVLYFVGVHGPGKVQATKWRRQGPEWRYNAQAQRLDRGLSPLDPVPGNVTARVRQLSPFTNGRHSNWVVGFFAR